MTIEWVLFLPAAVLLLFPGNLFLPAGVEMLSFERFRNASGKSRWILLRCLDPVRAFGAAFALKVSLPLTSDMWAYVPGQEYGVLVGVLMAGVALQTFTLKEPDVLLSPTGYVVGVLFALVPWPVAGVALIAGITCLFAFRQFMPFFAMVAMVAAAIGVLFETPVIWVLPAVGLVFVPVVASLVTGRTLEIPVREDTGQ
jgi:hypothetical protein